VKVEPVDRRRELVDASDDLVRILTKLTSDLERFDALLLLHRKMLEHQAAGEAGGSDMLTRQSERLGQEAAEMMASVRQTLEQLRELSPAIRPRARG
jgi:hypothetical protein